MKLNYIFIGMFLVFLLGETRIYAQQSPRQYKKYTVLAGGSWYKLAVSEPGVYKITGSLLKSMGMAAHLPTGAIRLLGTGGQMLDEATGSPRYDDLPEVALYAQDNGDG